MQVNTKMYNPQILATDMGMAGFKRPFFFVLERSRVLSAGLAFIAISLKPLHFSFYIRKFEITKHITRPLAASRITVYQLLNAFFMVSVARVDFCLSKPFASRRRNQYGDIHMASGICFPGGANQLSQR